MSFLNPFKNTSKAASPRHGRNLALISAGVIVPAILVSSLAGLLNPATPASGLDRPTAIPVQAHEAQTLPIETGAYIRSYLLQNPDVIVEVLTVLNARAKETARSAKLQSVQANQAALHKDGRSYVGGNLDGSITVVEFVDFKCGYCRKAHDEIKRMVADNPDVRLIVKQFPILGPESLIAAKAAQGVQDVMGSQAYALFSDALIAFEGPLNDQTLARIFKEIGFDAGSIASVETQMESPEMGALLSYTRELAAELEIKGTPAFVINDDVVAGYITPDRMTGVLERTRTRLLATNQLGRKK